MAWMLASPQMHSAFASLGAPCGEGYHVGEDCLIALDDILQRLALEDRVSRPFRRAVALGQHVRRDLVPLLIHARDTSSSNASAIMDATVRLLVELTVPVECLMTDGASVDVLHDLGRLLVSSKEAFADVRLTRALLDHMRHMTQRLDFSNGTPDTTKLCSAPSADCDAINNCLLLIRNVLHVPEPSLPSAAVNVTASVDDCGGCSLQNRILWNLFAHSADRVLLQLLQCPQRACWVVAMVQLIALLYKDQHVNTLQRLLSVSTQAGLSDSSDDNESNTSPPDHQVSGDSSPLLTSDPTSDSSDNGTRACNAQQHAVRSAQNRNKMLLTSNEAVENRGPSAAPAHISLQSAPSTPLSSCSSGGGGTATTTYRYSHQQEVSGKRTPHQAQSQAELSDYGYGTQAENQGSISTSSNEDEAAPTSHYHHHHYHHHHHHHHYHKPAHLVHKARSGTGIATGTTSVTTVMPDEKRDQRRKKLVKRGRSHVKVLAQYTPTDDDISHALKEFTVDFLLNGYGCLVSELLQRLLCDARLHMDTSHFFWLVTYFLRFATQLELSGEHVASVLSYPVFAYLTYEAVELCEAPALSNTSMEAGPRSRRAHLAVTAMREALNALTVARRRPDATRLRVRLAACVDLRLLFVLLLRSYEPNVDSRQYLHDLVLANHTLMLLLDGEHTPLHDHLRHLSTDVVIHRYGLLLQDFHTNDENVNDCAFTLLHHVAGDVGCVHALFQPAVLRAFSCIWESNCDLRDDWRDLIEYVIHQFIGSAQSSSSIIAADQADGYISEEDSVNGFDEVNDSNEEWTEEEADALYWFYIQSKDSDDVVGSVVRLYRESGSGNKSRRAVAARLLRQDLVADGGEDLLRSRLTEDVGTAYVRRLVERVSSVDSGRAVHWLQTTLLTARRCRLAVTDADTGSLEPVAYCCARLRRALPLVPWTEEQAHALGRRSFVALLRALGVRGAGTAGQYARIPEHWSAKRLLDAARCLGPVHDVSPPPPPDDQCDMQQSASPALTAARSPRSPLVALSIMIPEAKVDDNLYTSVPVVSIAAPVDLTDLAQMYVSDEEDQ